jgi:arginine:agmatine antiporter
VIVGVLMTVVLFATMSPTLADQFNLMIDLAVVLAVVPYIYASVALVKVIFDQGLPLRTFRTYKWIAIAAVAYCLWAVIGGDPKTVVHALVALLLSVPLYPFFIQSMEAAQRRKQAAAGGTAHAEPRAQAPTPLDEEHQPAAATASGQPTQHEDESLTVKT